MCYLRDYSTQTDESIYALEKNTRLLNAYSSTQTVAFYDFRERLKIEEFHMLTQVPLKDS